MALMCEQGGIAQGDAILQDDTVPITDNVKVGAVLAKDQAAPFADNLTMSEGRVHESTVPYSDNLLAPAATDGTGNNTAPHSDSVVITNT